MGRLSNIKVNIPQVNLEDYFWLIAGIPKAGKTSLFAKLVEQYFGDINKGLLLAFEKGYQALKVQATDVTDWADFESIANELVEQKNDLGIQFLGIDTADILYEMAVAQVIKEWNRENPSKRTKDINGVGAKKAGGQGFGVGYNLVKKKIRDVIDKLMKAGYGIAVLTHSKDKKVEQKDGLEYDQLNVSLASSAREVFVNMADFIVFITIEKEKDEDDNIVTKRYMYFRTDGYVEAGSRFKNVPERIEYDVTEFIEVFKKAVESEFENGADLDTIKKEQKEKREKSAEEFINQTKNSSSANEIIATIDVKVKSFDKKKKLELSDKLKEVLGGSNNYKVIDDVELLEKCLDVVNEMM